MGTQPRGPHSEKPGRAHHPPGFLVPRSSPFTETSVTADRLSGREGLAMRGPSRVLLHGTVGPVPVN